VADDSAGSGPSAEDRDVVDRLVSVNDFYVNDSFQWSYLPLPSLVAPPALLPSAVGRTLQANLETIVPLLTAPGRPFTAVVGGDRPYARLHALRGIVLRADTVLVGGAMALPFLQAVGRHPPGNQPRDFLDGCRQVFGLAKRVNHPIQLPLDLVWLLSDGTVEVARAGRDPGGRVVDVGPQTRLRFAEFVQGSGSLLWCGALGEVEDDRFVEGSSSVASAVGSSEVVVGGEALVALLDRAGLLTPSTKILTATDSALELLEAGDLPALLAIRAGVTSM
jgi:phosphoglycerate kinase